jgi:AcrR family transcriptional regulator
MTARKGEAVAARAPRGRRPPGSGTKEAIAVAARSQFGTQGYQKTSLRSIAAEAGVDPRLVLHFYGSKQKLFLSVVELPFDPVQVFPVIIGDGGPGVGRRLAQFVIGVLDSPERRSVATGILRAATSEEEAARLWRDVVAEKMLLPLASRVSRDHPELRAALAASQIVGLIMVRHVVAVTPMADAPSEQLVDAIAPVLEHYLTGDLTATGLLVIDGRPLAIDGRTGDR